MTDDYDKRLLCTFTSVWFNPDLLTADFKFFEGYGIPDCRNLEEYMEFISSLPLQVIQTDKESGCILYLQDIPEVFGLHSNADITYQINTAAGILDQILEVQPKDSAGGGKGESREGTVKRLAEDMLRWFSFLACISLHCLHFHCPQEASRRLLTTRGERGN